MKSSWLIFNPGVIEVPPCAPVSLDNRCVCGTGEAWTTMNGGSPCSIVWVCDGVSETEVSDEPAPRIT